MEGIIFILPFPPSVNTTYLAKAYSHNGTKGTPALIAWKKSSKAALDQYDITELPKNFMLKRLKLDVTLKHKWITKKGEPLIKDVDNRIKLVQDALATGLGFDDKWIWEVSAKKCHEEDLFGSLCVLSLYK